MYFSEFLETCTIRWVSFCEGGVGVGKKNAENAFFEFFLQRLSTHPTPGAPCIPRRWRPQPPAHPERLSSAGRARYTRAGKCQGRLHKARRTRRADQDGGGRWTACNVSGKVYNFGRLFLSIFIWIYFAKSIDNPYIYGYNIISPDKYGLQPQYTKTGGQKP